MQCFSHPQQDAVLTCQLCGRPICLGCTIDIGTISCCRECYKQAVECVVNSSDDGNSNLEELNSKREKVFFSTVLKKFIWQFFPLGVSIYAIMRGGSHTFDICYIAFLSNEIVFPDFTKAIERQIAIVKNTNSKMVRIIRFSLYVYLLHSGTRLFLLGMLLTHIVLLTHAKRDSREFVVWVFSLIVVAVVYIISELWKVVGWSKTLTKQMRTEA
jgi:hypothetical protein